MDRWALLEPPLLDAQAKGNQVALLGRGDIDGAPTIELDLTFPSGAKEKWHLDANTYLELAIDATVRRLHPGRRADERKGLPERFPQGGQDPDPLQGGEGVPGAVIRLLEIQEVKLNQGWPAESSACRLNDGMEKLRPLAGEFEVKLELPPPRPGLPWQVVRGARWCRSWAARCSTKPSRSTTAPASRSPCGAGRGTASTSSTGSSRTTTLTTHPNVFTGKLEDGKIAVDDLSTGSAGQQNGQETLERFRVEVKGARRGLRRRRQLGRRRQDLDPGLADDLHPQEVGAFPWKRKKARSVRISPFSCPCLRIRRRGAGCRSPGG